MPSPGRAYELLRVASSAQRDQGIAALLQHHAPGAGGTHWAAVAAAVHGRRRRAALRWWCPARLAHPAPVAAAAGDLRPGAQRSHSGPPWPQVSDVQCDSGRAGEPVNLSGCLGDIGQPARRTAAQVGVRDRQRVLGYLLALAVSTANRAGSGSATATRSPLIAMTWAC